MILLVKDFIFRCPQSVNLTHEGLSISVIIRVLKSHLILIQGKSAIYYISRLHSVEELRWVVLPNVCFAGVEVPQD